MEDLLQEHERFLNHSVVNFLVPPKRMLPKKLLDEVFVYTTHCPGKSCNQTAMYNWTCSRCGKTLIIGNDDFLYCDCGQSSLYNPSYKCPDPKHGDQFDQHNDEYIKQYLSSSHYKNISSTRKKGTVTETSMIQLRNQCEGSETLPTPATLHATTTTLPSASGGPVTTVHFTNQVRKYVFYLA